MRRHFSVWGLAWILACATTASEAQELCGIDTIFTDGFDPPTFTPVNQLTGGIVSPGLAQDITGTGTLSVTITSPATGTTTGDNTVDVSGTFVGPMNTGITVNGTHGYAANGLFVVPNVPLSAGSNSLNATAIILPGATATYTGSITQSGSASPVTIQAARQTGFAPFAVSFNFTIGVLPVGGVVQSVAINFKGSGPDDFTGTSLTGAPTSYTYARAGLYTAQLRVTDDNSTTYTAYRTILIQDIAAQRGLMCDVYGYLKDRLMAQDAAHAVYAYQPGVQSTYLALFNTLGTNMPTVAQNLGFIVSGFIGSGFAELTLVRDNADQTRNGYPLHLTQGSDGVWRISEM